MEVEEGERLITENHVGHAYTILEGISLTKVGGEILFRFHIPLLHISNTHI